ncbi:MAG: hypothetical protein BHV77_01695 [Bacteroides sp. 43_108]|nr:MAG: hypothetical protein BHV77_01695 [Bacteroides sp. 43_108]
MFTKSIFEAFSQRMVLEMQKELKLQVLKQKNPKRPRQTFRAPTMIVPGARKNLCEPSRQSL